ncbi:D-alanyl-D-alanine carboxypeptidase [Pseudoscardovia radai]|uniref:D-alanyl-D-alanine carboxypeptidase n=1 Tax=Pseudoscardovia radai TaxID=987066 RepID=UPI00399295BF
MTDRGAGTGMDAQNGTDDGAGIDTGAGIGAVAGADAASVADTTSRRRRITPAATRILVSAGVVIVLFAAFAIVHGGVLGRGGADSTRVSSISVRPAKATVSTLADDLDTSASVDTAAVQQIVDDYSATAGLGTTYSIVVLDADGTQIAGHDADVAREPASTTKTLTAYAASATLDLNRTLDTQVFLRGSGSSSSSSASADGATIVLKGNGDVLLGDGESDPTHTNGRAGLATLARRTADALAADGISQVTLDYDDTLFGSKRLPDGIEETNENYIYEMPASSMAIDLDRQWGGGGEADPDRVTSYPSKTDTPAQNVATRFAQLLAEDGIAVTNADAPVSAAVGDGDTQLTSVSSAPLWQVMSFMLKNSSNTLAEEFGRLVALQAGYENSPEGAARAVTDIITNAGIHSDGLELRDCSGLTLGTRISALTLADVQRHLATMGETASAPVLEGLIVPGIDRLHGTYGEASYGVLFTKTGTLSNVRSLAGTATTTNGGALFFAVVCVDMGDFAAVGNANEAFAGSLAAL